jgi:hypothetical protein
MNARRASGLSAGQRHPNAAGYQAMAGSIELSLFAP